MRAAAWSRRSGNLLPSLLVVFFFAASASATTQLTLRRGETAPHGEYVGVIDLTVDPGFEDARVWISIDGQKIAEGMRWPHKVTVDFGPTAIEHKIAVTAVGSSKRRVQWHETINKGHLPLSVQVRPVDLANRIFEARTTAPETDPVVVVEVWHRAEKIATVSDAPFRFEVPAEVLSSGFVQVTARSKGGDEAADFWSAAGDVHVESIQVRTVPIFVSVVDRKGTTHGDVDRALFRIMDNEAEGMIVEFGNAFDQPISIALLLDASASMTGWMPAASRAAQEFTSRTLKPGDRCSVTAIHDVPRRKQPLTSDTELVKKALETIRPAGRTALYDAIASALRELNEEKNRRAVVILTDGDDTESTRSFEEVEKAAVEAGIPLYFIVYNTGFEANERRVEQLRHLAAQTGGFVAVATNQNLTAKYSEIEKDLRAQFAILYQVTDFVRPKEWRRIRVTLASPKFTARTIRGYFTP